MQISEFNTLIAVNIIIIINNADLNERGNIDKQKLKYTD
jgi:hypothetical protein